MGFFDFIKDARTPQRIRQCTDDMIVMFDTAEEIFGVATAYALDNEPLTMDLKLKDNLINEKESEIRRTMFEHLRIDPWQDLTFCITLISIVQDAERVGDLGKSIAKSASLAHKNRLGTHTQTLREIRDEVAALFPKMKQGFVEHDEQFAREVMTANQEIKQKTTQFLTDLANDTTLSSNEAVVLTLLGRMIGRVASHLSNIVSSVALPFDQIRRAPTWTE